MLAEQKGWILYLEGSTDFNMLKSFAKKLEHQVVRYLDNSFVKYVKNIPQNARTHFYGLKEALPDLKGIALFDRIEKKLRSDSLYEMMWKRNEIENYLPLPEY